MAGINFINEEEYSKPLTFKNNDVIHVVGCRICGNDYKKLKKNNNSIRYCNKCDKAV